MEESEDPKPENASSNPQAADGVDCKLVAEKAASPSPETPFTVPQVPDGVVVFVALLFAFVVLRWRKLADAAARYMLLRNRRANGGHEALCRSLETAAPVAERDISRAIWVTAAGLLVVVAAVTAFYSYWEFETVSWVWVGTGLAVVATLVCVLPPLNRWLFTQVAAWLDDAGGAVVREYWSGLDVVRKAQYEQISAEIRENR